ncbi:hypothetical protein D3C85_1018860 [compost metagenome]
MGMFIALVSFGCQGFNIFFTNAFDLAEAEAKGMVFSGFFLQKVIPCGIIDVYGANFHAMFFGVYHNLGRLIKSHWHTV